MNPPLTSLTWGTALHWADHRWRRMQREQRLRAARQRLPGARAAARDIPEALKLQWLAGAGPDSAGLAAAWRADEPGWELSTLALAHFFELCRQQPAQAPLALPSAAADSVWHLWLATDAEGLAAWQRRWVGGEVPHREAHELGAPLPTSLARCWVAACRSEGRSALDGPLPLLFALDGLVGPPGGWHYQRGPRGISHHDLGPQGRPLGSPQRHPELSAAGLAGLGLLTATELQAWRLRREGAEAGVSSGGGTDGCGGDAAGTGCGGCSCGSGCGGGCGS